MLSKSNKKIKWKRQKISNRFKNMKSSSRRRKRKKRRRMRLSNFMRKRIL